MRELTSASSVTVPDPLELLSDLTDTLIGCFHRQAAGKGSGGQLQWARPELAAASGSP